jgi:hypothetical protein
VVRVTALLTALALLAASPLVLIAVAAIVAALVWEVASR